GSGDRAAAAAPAAAGCRRSPRARASPERRAGMPGASLRAVSLTTIAIEQQRWIALDRVHRPVHRRDQRAGLRQKLAQLVEPVLGEILERRAVVADETAEIVHRVARIGG